MKTHVGHAVAGAAGDAGEGAELVDDNARQFGGVDLHDAAAEALPVREADMGSDIGASREFATAA